MKIKNLCRVSWHTQRIIMEYIVTHAGYFSLGWSFNVHTGQIWKVSLKMSKTSWIWKCNGLDSCWSTTYSGVGESDPVAVRSRVRHQSLHKPVLVHAAYLHQLSAVILTHLLSCRPRWCRGIRWKIAVTTWPVCCVSIRTCAFIGGERCTSLCNHLVTQICENLVTLFTIIFLYNILHVFLYCFNNQDHVHHLFKFFNHGNLKQESKTWPSHLIFLYFIL